MTTKRTHEKKPTETIGICEVNMEKVPFQPVAWVLSDVGMEIFLRLEDKAVSADNVTQQVKSQGAIKPGGLKTTSNQTNNAAMLSPNSYPNNKKNQHLRFDKNVQTANRWMEDESKDRNYKFPGAKDNLAIGKSMHQPATATINDERFFRHVERGENTKAPIWDLRRTAPDRIIKPDTGSKTIGDFLMNVEDDSDDTTDVDSDFEETNFHEWLARRRMMEKLVVERNLLKSLSSGTTANSRDCGRPLRDPFECSRPSNGQNNDKKSVLETKQYLEHLNDRLDKISSNLAKERYGGLLHDQRRESGPKFRTNSLAVDGCTCQNLGNKISPIRHQDKQVKYGEACASNSGAFCKVGPGGTCHGYQTSTPNNVNNKLSPTSAIPQKSSCFDSVSPDRKRQENVEPKDNNTDGTVVRQANNCMACNEDGDRKDDNAYRGSEDLKGDPNDVDKSDPQNSQSSFNLDDLPEESRNKAAIAKFKEYSHNMKKEIRVSRAKMNNLVKQFKRLQAKDRPQISDSSSTVSGKNEGSYSSWCAIL